MRPAERYGIPSIQAPLLHLVRALPLLQSNTCSADTRDTYLGHLFGVSALLSGGEAASKGPRYCRGVSWLPLGFGAANQTSERRCPRSEGPEQSSRHTRFGIPRRSDGTCRGGRPVGAKIGPRIETSCHARRSRVPANGDR